MVVTWCTYTLWKNPFHLVNLHISSYIIFMCVWKHLSFILSVNVNYIIQCYQLYLLCFILDPSDSTSCALEGPRKREVLFHFSQTEKCLCLSLLKLTSQILVPKSASVIFSYSFPPAWPLRYFSIAAAAATKLLQSCPTLWDPIEGSPPGSAVPGILQARTLEWVAISFSNAWKWKVKVKSLSPVWLLWPHGLQPTRLLRPWDFPGKSTGVGCHCLLRLLN